MQAKDVYRIQIRRQGSTRGRNGQFTTRAADPKVIQVDHGNTAALAQALVDAMPRISGSQTARVDRVQVEFIGTLEPEAVTA